MIFLKKKQSGLTLIEVLVAVIVIAIALLSIIAMMRVSIEYTDKARQDSIAINLAREGMEQVYTIRNTNRLRRSGKKDKNWLCANPSLANTTDNCGTRMQSGISYILLSTGTNGNIYPYLSGVAGKLNLNDAASDNVFRLLYGTGVGNIFGKAMRYHTGGTTPTTPEGKFYREIRGYGLYQKNVDVVGALPITTCTNGASTYTKRNRAGTPGTSTNCDDETPKEFRFCSNVEYDKKIKSKVELCGIITNYKQ